jgi:hypothetical protein
LAFLSKSETIDYETEVSQSTIGDRFRMGYPIGYGRGEDKFQLFSSKSYIDLHKRVIIRLMSSTDQDRLVEEYAKRIQPILASAQKAYGRRDQDTPAHVNSRQYTQLLVEFTSKGGSLQRLARRLSVSYSGMRRRVTTSDVPPLKTPRKSQGQIEYSTVSSAADRVRNAKRQGTSGYHAQLYEEFNNGIPMNLLARELGISNAAPLYYGVQSHYKRSLHSAS